MVMAGITGAGMLGAHLGTTIGVEIMVITEIHVELHMQVVDEDQFSTIIV